MELGQGGPKPRFQERDELRANREVVVEWVEKRINDLAYRNALREAQGVYLQGSARRKPCRTIEHDVVSYEQRHKDKVEAAPCKCSASLQEVLRGVPPADPSVHDRDCRSDGAR